MPEEYASRQSVTPLDYGELTGGLIDTLRSVQQERQSKRESLEKQFDEANKAIRDTEQLRNKSANEIIFEGATEGANRIAELKRQMMSGEIKPSDAVRIKNKMKDDWTNLANNMKMFDETMSNFYNRQQAAPGKIKPGSSFEQFLGKQYADLADLTNTRIHIDPETGGVYLAKFNDDGSVKRLIDPKRVHNPGNMVDNNIDLTETVNSYTDTWPEWTIATSKNRGKVGTVADARQNKAYDDMVVSTVNSILNNPRTVANVLVDNSDYGMYDFYATEDQRQGILDEYESSLRDDMRSVKLSEDEISSMMSEKEKQLIKVVEDETGTMQPMPTDEQFNAAKQIVRNNIEISLGRKEAETSGFSPNVSSPDSGDSKKPDVNIYPELSAAWKAGAEGEDTLTNLSGGRYKFRWEPGGLTVYSIQEWIAAEIAGEDPVPIARKIRNLKDIAPYIYGSTGAAGSEQAIADYESDRAAYKNKGGGGSKPNNEDPLGIK